MALPIRFGVSTWLWTSPFTTKSIDELFPKIADMGFDEVEIAVEYPEMIDTKALVQGLERYRLKPCIVGAFGPTRDLTHEDPVIQQNCLNYIRDCLQLAADVGAGFVGGPMYSAVGKARMVPAAQRQQEWQLAVANLRKVCELAADMGLQIALEPLNRFESDLVNTAEDARRMVEAIEHPAARIMLDSFHMGIEEPSIAAAIATAGDLLIHLQVAENYRGTPGTGQTNWKAYYQALDAIHYSGAVSIESFTTDNQELAGAVCFWRPMAASQDAFASDGLKFLKQWARGGANQ
jgi:D-psicose/D-tagatose/L-ribulose 3-epimerase